MRFSQGREYSEYLFIAQNTAKIVVSCKKENSLENFWSHSGIRIWVPDAGAFGSRKGTVLHIFYIIIYKSAQRCRAAADNGKMRKRDTFGKARGLAKTRGAYPFETEKSRKNAHRVLLIACI